MRREAVEVLFGRRDGIEAVIGALESRALHASELDPAVSSSCRPTPDPSLQARARKVLAAEASASRDRNQIIASYRPAIQLAGDRDKGREVFAKVCATCHQAEGRGVDVGPDLATVASRSPEDLLTHILDPNREVAPNFVNYNVALQDGRVVSGIIADESANCDLTEASGRSDGRDRERSDRDDFFHRRFADARRPRERAFPAGSCQPDRVRPIDPAHLEATAPRSADEMSGLTRQTWIESADSAISPRFPRQDNEKGRTRRPAFFAKEATLASEVTGRRSWPARGRRRGPSTRATGSR